MEKGNRMRVDGILRGIESMKNYHMLLVLVLVLVVMNQFSEDNFEI